MSRVHTLDPVSPLIDKVRECTPLGLVYVLATPAVSEAATAAAAAVTTVEGLDDDEGAAALEALQTCPTAVVPINATKTITVTESAGFCYCRGHLVECQGARVF